MGDHPGARPGARGCLWWTDPHTTNSVQPMRLNVLAVLLSAGNIHAYSVVTGSNRRILKARWVIRPAGARLRALPYSSFIDSSSSENVAIYGLVLLVHLCRRPLHGSTTVVVNLFKLHTHAGVVIGLAVAGLGELRQILVHRFRPLENFSGPPRTKPQFRARAGGSSKTHGRKLPTLRRHFEASM